MESIQKTLARLPLQVINESQSRLSSLCRWWRHTRSFIRFTPKDFDIATNATPEQVKRVFGRQCQIIGRRFQLAHVYQERHLFEVATFRAPHDNQSQRSQTSAHGMITRDNVWGTIDQDALRRDFTANALYYNPKTGEILDFANGLADIKRKKLRMIGDPSTRYREDPVRMLRAARLSAKLDFSIEEKLLNRFII